MCHPMRVFILAKIRRIYPLITCILFHSKTKRVLVVKALHQLNLNIIPVKPWIATIVKTSIPITPLIYGIPYSIRTKNP